MSRFAKIMAIATIAGISQAACTGTTEPGSVLTVRFQAASQGGGTNSSESSVASGNAAISITGTNGILTLDDLRLVVSEFELKRSNVPDNNNNDDDSSSDESEEFEAPPVFVQVPLIAGETPVVQQAVPPGQYTEFEFSVEDLDEDPNNDDFADLIALLTEVRNEFADWPIKASMLATGTFTPTGGTPVAFRVFFEAEIEIEMEFSPPLIVEADAVGAVVDVTVDPRVWFLRGDGTVMDLSQFDFDTTGELVEFEFEMEGGFTEIEFDD